LFLSRMVALAAVVALAGCATGHDQDVQRATEGPTADEIYRARFLGDYGRLPTFDESSAFRAELDDRVSSYLAAHPDVSTSPRASQFTFHRRVAVGMTRDEVVVLAGAPTEVSRDEAEMQASARQFWPAVRRRATEMWQYPGGWSLYFDRDRLVDLTVIGKAPL
jgi:hypothetical protein